MTYLKNIQYCNTYILDVLLNEKIVSFTGQFYLFYFLEDDSFCIFYGSPWIWYFNEHAQSYVKIITCHFELNWRYDYILRGIFHFNICNIIQNWVFNDIAHQNVIHLKTSRCFQSHVFSRLANSLLWRHIQLCTVVVKCTRKGHER